ncbi:hypothetical protein Hanom_Chr08g00719791 [Helianthus anomalus]
MASIRVDGVTASIPAMTDSVAVPIAITGTSRGPSEELIIFSGILDILSGVSFNNFDTGYFRENVICWDL